MRRASIVILALGLAAAETGGERNPWVKNRQGSSALGPYQLTQSTAMDIAHRRVGWLGRKRIPSHYAVALDELYARAQKLDPGDHINPSPDEREAYYHACSAQWDYLSAVARRKWGIAGDVYFIREMWRWGEGKPSQFDSVKAFLDWSAAQPGMKAYHQRFRGAL